MRYCSSCIRLRSIPSGYKTCDECRLRRNQSYHQRKQSSSNNNTIVVNPNNASYTQCHQLGLPEVESTNNQSYRRKRQRLNQGQCSIKIVFGFSYMLFYILYIVIIMTNSVF
jgi:hypothetical protein